MLLFALLVIPTAWAERSLVQVPLTFDYPLLRQLLIRQMFDKDGETAEILNDPSACNRIVLSDPQLTPRGDELEIISTVDAKLGVALLGSCKQLLSWQGGVGFLGKPLIEPGGTAVSFAPSIAWLIAPDGSMTTSGPLWDMAEEKLLAFFGSFTLDLAPYIQSLGGLLPDVLPRRTVQELQAVVDSLKLMSDIQVTAASLNASISFEVEALEQARKAEAALSEEELQQWETRWQLMDTVLVLAVKRYAAATGQQELRDALLDSLIDSRYRLLDALGSPPDQANDAVRSWFLDSWQQLSPVIRSIAPGQHGQGYLLLLSVLSATDALAALDQLGPGIGLEISEDGLKRLARMINGNQGEGELRYDEEIDPELQQLLQQQLQPEVPPPSALHFNFSLLPRAHAAPANKLNSWIPDHAELGNYLSQIERLLDSSSEKLLNRRPLQPEYRKLFKHLVLATAWQESCWRQYVVANKKIVPLSSSSGDVGLMQVNQRVWRGFYDIQRLRWDIEYNSDSGAEILLDYLTKYALKRGEQKHSGGQANLARASYSAYNGGPSAVSRYRRAGVPTAHRKIDEAFWDKYRQVAAGNEMRVAQCLGGDTAGGKNGVATAPVVSKPPVPTDPGKSWVLAQRQHYFTLQLGAFSSREAASQFIRKEAIPAPTHIVIQRKSNATQYLVLQGVYADRATGESMKRKFARLEPWLRKFGDLR